MIELPRSAVARAETKSLAPRRQRSYRPANVRQRSAGAAATPKYFNYKYAVERVVAVLLLIPALPVIAVCGFLVRLNSRGPMIYRQDRVGTGNNVFSMYKIRTMEVDAESDSGPTWSSQNDPRVTRVGRILRFLHLDELPQLFNVIKGDMAIIGPRPERPDFVNVLSQRVEGYSDRLVVKPGITGLAQIYLPPDETIDCVRKKVCFDRAYIESASPTIDLQIWFCTIVRILGLRQGRGPKWIGLDRRFRNVKSECSKTQNKSDNTLEIPFEPAGSSDQVPVNVQSMPTTTEFSVDGQASSAAQEIDRYPSQPK